MTEDAKKSAAAKDASATEKGRAEDQPKPIEKEEPTSSTDEEVMEAEVVDNSADSASTEKSDSTEVSEPEVSNNSDDSDEKTSADDKAEASAAEKTARANSPKEDSSTADEDNTDENVESDKSAKNSQKSNSESTADTAKPTAEFQEEIREQIENCKFELIAAVQESVHAEISDVARKQIRKVERRRRVGYLVRDILILLLAAMIGYMGYCLYDVKYFDFMKSDCERNNTCSETDNSENGEKTPEIIKDTAWYRNNYGYLYDNLQVGLSADKVEAYYLYSGDYKVSEIQPTYLLGMAYNHLNSSTSYDSANGIVVPAADLRQAYINLVGDADHFAKHDFTYHCANFQYDKNADTFSASSVLCADNTNRTILEQIDEIYEEGNVLYFLTTATIFDRKEQNFYTFDNLFKPVASNVGEDDLAKHASLLNHYQYQFNKVDNQYYFSGITKLK